MSQCKLILFKNGLPDSEIEFSNAWGGAARIWGSLFDKYLKDPNIPFDNWLLRFSKNPDDLWLFSSRKDLPIFERAVNASTFDMFYVKRSNFKRFAADLYEFVKKYPTKGVDHLISWAEVFDSSDAEAIGFHGTTVSNNLWWEWDEDGEIKLPVRFSEGFEVYEQIEAMKGEGAN